VDRHFDKRLAFAWKCGILGLLFSCLVDFDHIWHFIFQVPDPINLTGIEGRPFHVWYIFLLYAVVVSLGIVAFVFRRHDSDMNTMSITA